MEALFASFLLLTSVLLSVQLFDSSLKAEADNEQRSVAAVVAENALDKVRNEALDDFKNLEILFNNKTWNDADNPNFRIKAKVEPQALSAPCGELESQYPNPLAVFPQPRPRQMSNSVWRVQIEVDWPRAGSSKVTVVEYFSSLKKTNDFRISIDPPGTDKIDEFTNGTFNVARNGVVDFVAKAYSDGEEIQDIQFSWYVEPLDGFGSVFRESRDGTECRYKNYFRNSNNAPKYSPGKCDLVVRAQFQGKEAFRKVRLHNL